MRVFLGEDARWPAGVFRTQERAESWIRAGKLAGMLTEHPLDTGVYAWAIEQGHFRPRAAHQQTPSFVGRFTTAYQEHFHHIEGDPDRSARIKDLVTGSRDAATHRFHHRLPGHDEVGGLLL
ncbi:DUF7710 domain-containing protein [Streptosporangium sandarakinum]|uniref:DUF7710 domain-containing protein n=1 Tax=Streptosporangium sandarakinum TaxID=1260955 RepID=UPI003F4CCC1E